MNLPNSLRGNDCTVNGDFLTSRKKKMVNDVSRKQTKGWKGFHCTFFIWMFSLYGRLFEVQ